MSDPTADPTADPATAPPKPSFEERMERFGQEVGAAGERLGRDAEAWGKRVSKDPGYKRAADTAGRIWGAIILALGIWFLFDYTLGYDMPRIPWGDLWPIGLIVIGLVVILRGMRRRTA
ncbi:MAG: hypothetical protein ABUL57_02090 [Chloroflexota bacterium]